MMAASIVVIGLFIGSLVVYLSLREGIEEWNPYPVYPSSLIGVWSSDNGQLRLNGDGTGVTSPRGGVTSHGHWYNDDWKLFIFSPKIEGTAYRVVIADGEYRIIDELRGDPDAWDGDLGLARTPPSTTLVSD